MSGNNVEIINSANQRAGMHEPNGIPTLGKNAKKLIEKLINLDSQDPNYPLSQPFEKYYSSTLTGTPDQYARKYTLARALLADGRLKDIRFLETAFIPQGEEIPPQVQALKDDLHVRVREELLKRGDEKEIEKAEKELTDFAQVVAEGKTLDAQEFIALARLFGSSRVVDIIYTTRPEFRGMPVEKVKSVIADFIGNNLPRRGGLRPDDVKMGLQHLGKVTFQEGFYETIKDYCLQLHNVQKKSGSIMSDRELMEESFKTVDSMTQAFNNPLVDQIIHRAKQYYESLWEEIAKPDQIVEQLKEGRSFPDLNQLINMKEIADKRKVVIADDMGLGKSASVILAKETLHLKCALITTPANVISTWQRYLSDQKVDGKQVGYFREGMAPKVVIVDNPLALHESDLSQADYVLISHEKLNESYTPVLEKVPFDMVIVDEIHKLKNLQGGKRRKGVRTANLVKLAQAAEGRNAYMALLSGTPVPNKVRDLAVILKLLHPEIFKDTSNRDLVRKIINGDILGLRSLLIPRMQMKNLRESLDIPQPDEKEIKVYLSDEEQEAYGVLMEDDELEATEKIKLLRQFLMNPRLLDVTPGMESSKIKAVDKHLNEVFLEKNKVVMFVNDYVEGIIRGKETIFDQMKLPPDVEICVIHGEVSKEERERIQYNLNSSNKRMLVVISGQTGDVGIDLSGGEEVVFYNEPWSKYDKQQQLARVYREGQKNFIRSTTFVTEGTIERGISIYIKMKYNAIEKLLRGIELSKIEKQLLEHDDKQEEPNLEVNKELAEYYFSSLDRLMRIFGNVRELGEEEFIKYLINHAKDYADCYSDLGSRNYQSNACRISATVISEMIEKQRIDGGEVKILDIASGPEMLKKHIGEKYQAKIISLDINHLHFREAGNNRIVGSFTALPIQNGSIDYADLTLALHYSIFRPSKGEYERLKVLTEINRVLKVGGKAVLNLMYNADIKDFEQFQKIAETLGFKITEEYTGEVIVGNRYRSRVITLEKVEEIDKELNAVIDSLDKKTYDGLKFSPGGRSLKDSRKIVQEFNINGENHHVNFNREDQVVLEEEERINTEGEELKNQFGGIKEIPKDVIIQKGYARIFYGNKYVLFKKLQNNNGVVIIR